MKNKNIYFAIRPPCTNFNGVAVEDTLRLGIKNKMIYFVLHSACCIFVMDIDSTYGL